MTVSNHMLAGSFIALAVHQPWIVLPLAAVSHFALDALPHFGYRRGNYNTMFKHRLTYLASALDIVGVIVLVLTIIFQGWLIFIAAMMAIAPDFAWPYRYYYYERKGLSPPDTWFSWLHHKIQWGERPWGIIFEIAFFVAGITLVLDLISRS